MASKGLGTAVDVLTFGVCVCVCVCLCVHVYTDRHGKVKRSSVIDLQCLSTSQDLSVALSSVLAKLL